jgi:hypothetical protein
MYQQLREEQVKEGNKCVTCGNGGPGATFPENKCIKCLLLKYKTMEKFVKLLSTPVVHNYKTEICVNWEQRRECEYGVWCKFAHGHADLREPGSFQTMCEAYGIVIPRA